MNKHSYWDSLKLKLGNTKPNVIILYIVQTYKSNLKKDLIIILLH